MLYRIVCCPAEPGRMLAANLPDWRERRPDCFLLLSFVFVASGDGSRILAGSSSVQWGLGFSGRLVFQKGAKSSGHPVAFPVFYLLYRRTAPLYFTNCGFLRGDHAALSSQQRASAKVSCAFWCLVFPVSDKPDRGCLGLRLYSCFFHLVIPAVQRAEFLEGRVLLDFPFCRTGCVLCLYPFPRGSFRGDIFQLGC